MKFSKQQDAAKQFAMRSPFSRILNNPTNNAVTQHRQGYGVLFFSVVLLQWVVAWKRKESHGKRILRSWLLALTLSLSLWGYAQMPPSVTVTIVAGGIPEPNIGNYIASPGFMVTLQLTGGTPRFVKIRGSVERVSPSPFQITVGQLSDSLPIFLVPGVPVPLTGASQKLSAFNMFRFSALQFSGISQPESLMIVPTDTEAPRNIRLPDGMYRICMTVSDLNDQPLTPLPACAMITIRCQPPDGVKINTSVPQPVGGISPLIAQDIASGKVTAMLQYENIDQTTCGNPQVKVVGRLERLSPSPFTITVSPDYIQSLQPFGWNTVQQLDGGRQLQAFGNFQENNLIATGIDLTTLRDPNTPSLLRLPDGNYRICYRAYYVNGNGTIIGDASDPNLGCGSFTLCSKPATAPQLTTPVNNLNISSSVPIITPTSPVVFTWIPPQFVCGAPSSGVQYEIELREMLDNQTVIDATNNPLVFQRIALPAATFVLDTNLYRNVLQQGKRYALRIRALSTNPMDTLNIENSGYSRVEGFQYGSNPDVTNVGNATPIITMQPPQSYYLPFEERKADDLDDIVTAYERGGRDTLLPIREYIAINLIHNGIAYNTDAIELFLTLNPLLVGLREVRLSNPARMPVFPQIPDSTLRRFSAQHSEDLAPDPAEANRFRILLDSLRAVNSALGDTAAIVVTNLLIPLEAFANRVQNVNRVAVDLLNDFMAEMLYRLQQRAAGNQKEENQLQSLAINMLELIENSPNTTSRLFPIRGRNARPSTGMASNMQLTLAGTVMLNSIEESNGETLPVQGPLLPMDVIVWRGATEPPTRAITASPELTGLYRVFFTQSDLYNHKNPSLKAKSPPGLASTARVSLPKLSRYKFWTLNKVTLKQTNAVDVETSDVFILNDKKKWGDGKRLHIILKVE